MTQRRSNTRRIRPSTTRFTIAIRYRKTPGVDVPITVVTCRTAPSDADRAWVEVDVSLGAERANVAGILG